MDGLIDVFTKLENASYKERKQIRAVQNRNGMDWPQINRNGIRPLQDKLLARKEVIKPRTINNLNSFWA